jgi:hypothetical protein
MISYKLEKFNLIRQDLLTHPDQRRLHSVGSEPLLRSAVKTRGSHWTRNSMIIVLQDSPQP